MREIGTRLGFSHSTVVKCLQRMTMNKSAQSMKRYSGQKPVTNIRTDHLIRRIIVKSPTSSSLDVLSKIPDHVTISARTIRRRLCSYGLAAHKPEKNHFYQKKYLGWTSILFQISELDNRAMEKDDVLRLNLDMPVWFFCEVCPQAKAAV